MATISAGFGSYKPLAVPKPTPHHHTSLFGEIEGGITGFVGHLGNDIVTSVAGIPMGVTMLFKHPIAGVEGIGTATWHDWSPLFRAGEALAGGNAGEAWRESRVWADHFYQHPLGPILDLAGFATLGVGTAARSADALASLGLVSKTGKLAEFGNLTKVVTAGHRADYLAKNPMASDAEITSHVDAMLAKDTRIRRVVERPSGQTVTRDWAKNPLIRARQKYIASVGESLANSPRLAGLHLDEVWGTGDQAFAKRWIHMNRGQRAAAAVVQVAREIGTVHTIAEKIKELGEFGALNHVMGPIRKAMEVHALRIEFGKASTKEAQAGLKADRMTYLKAVEKLPGQELIGPEMDKAFAKGGLEQALKTVGADHTTSDISQAMTQTVNGVKHVLVVRGKDDIGRITSEARNSMKVAHAILTKPVSVWKWMILAASPRYFVNNVVGNSFMLMMMADPITMSLAMFHHIATTRGIKKANAAWEEATRASLPADAAAAKIALRQSRREVAGQGAVNQLLASEHQGMAQSEQYDLANLGKEDADPLGRGNASTKQTLTGRAAHKAGVGKIYEKTKHGLYGPTHKWSDTLHRDVAFNAAVTRTPEYQMYYTQYLKRHGISRLSVKGQMRARDYATKRALRSEAVRSYVREQANHTLGQYHTFYSWERTVRKFVPFYSWDRAITRHTAEMVKTRPYQAAILSTIGQRGAQETKDMLGQLPDFLQGVIPAKAISAGSGPLGLLGLVTGNAKGREGVIETQGINPYATIGDLVKTGESVVGLGSGHGIQMGSSLGGQLNPLLQGAIEGISGTSLLTGGPVSQQPFGLVGDVYGGTFSNVPIINVAKLMLQKEGLMGGYAHQAPNATHPLLFKKDLRSGLSSILGVPTRQVSRETAAELYLTEQHKKKKASGDARILPIRGSSSFGGNMPGF